MALGILKIWATEILTKVDLNAMVANIHNNALALISPLTGNLAAGSNKITDLATGSAAGDSVRYEDIGLRLIQTQAAAASATIDFTAGLTATYDEYIVKITDIVPATNNADFWLRVHQAGAFLSGASDYAHARLDFTSAVSSGVDGSGATTKIILANGLSSFVFNSLNAELRFHRPSATTNRKQFQWQADWERSDSNEVGAVGSGDLRLNTLAIDGIRFMMSTGDITSGTFALYGVRKT